jgi:hypothetical protein
VSGNPEQACTRQNIGHVIGRGSEVVVTIRPPTIPQIIGWQAALRASDYDRCKVQDGAVASTWACWKPIGLAESGTRAVTAQLR